MHGRILLQKKNKENRAKLCIFTKSACLFISGRWQMSAQYRLCDTLRKAKSSCLMQFTKVCLHKRCMHLPVTAVQFHCFITFFTFYHFWCHSPTIRTSLFTCKGTSGPWCLKFTQRLLYFLCLAQFGVTEVILVIHYGHLALNHSMTADTDLLKPS